MKILWVYAHPDAQSLNGTLRDDGVRYLREQGHQVEHSDLYAMGWKAVADGDDFTDYDGSEPVRYGPRSEQAFRDGHLTEEIKLEQRKLEVADIVLFQFPLWWYSCPAILKGWFDRVFTKGFAYGIMDPDTPGRTLRYGHGLLEGKRAMLIVTAGGREASLGPRGVNGHIDEILFPIQHGTLWYTGMSVLPPLVYFGANRVDDETFQTMSKTLRNRLDTLDTSDAIPFRYQNRGDYDDDLVLIDTLMPHQSGLSIHLESYE
ncbi:NAD(P)H-dependent oxidoreductase [Rhodococcus rhodochrous]|uniref:NAD(P)H-dependent oxidoreductase n=1 Tax=Rhodococcus rhodochrous TaxID=1829 RepID=UPI000E75CD2D